MDLPLSQQLRILAAKIAALEEENDAFRTRAAAQARTETSFSVDEDPDPVNDTDPLGGLSEFAYLLGRTPRAETVKLVVKIRESGPKEIDTYNLVTGQRQHLSGAALQNIDSLIDHVRRLGHPIQHPAGLPADGVKGWVDYGRSTAAERGLAIG